MFSIIGYDVDDSGEFTSTTITLADERIMLDVTLNHGGTWVTLTDIFGEQWDWYEDTKQWYNRDKEACPEPKTWEDSYWRVVTEAKTLIQQFENTTIQLGRNACFVVRKQVK